MDKKAGKQIVFVLLIISLVFFSISQIVPWASINYENTEAATTYSWGIKSEVGNIQGSSSLVLFIQDAKNIMDARSENPEVAKPIETESNIYVTGEVILFVTWTIALITIFCAIITCKNYYDSEESKFKKNLKTTVALSIIVTGLYYISLVFLIMQPFKDELSILAPGSAQTIQKINISWNWGFFLFLIATILIIIIAIKGMLEKYSDEREMEEKKPDVIQTP